MVEAVFEDRKVKSDAIAKKAEAVISKDTAIFASNTSTLPITSLTSGKFKDRPEQFRRYALFLASGDHDADRSDQGQGRLATARLAVALDYIRAIKKTPIMVNDTRGFYANRLRAAITFSKGT